MSSANRGAERTPLDAYYTPDAVARACVATIATDIRGVIVLEPHAGGGAFVRALLRLTPRVLVNDINPDAPALLAELGEEGWCCDYLGGGVTKTGIDWTVGNPPFTNAEAHVRRALASSRIGVAFLLRLAFLESTKRLAFWREHPPAEVHVLSRRPSFTGGGTDSAAYGWFVWRVDRDPKEPTTLHWIDWSTQEPR